MVSKELVNAYSQDSPPVPNVDLFADRDDNAAQQQIWSEIEDTRLQAQHPLSPASTISMVANAPDQQQYGRRSFEKAKANLVPPNVDNLTQANLLSVPQVVQLYEANKFVYTNPTATMASCLERGVALAQALLAHYYPADQGFEVRVATFDVMMKHGYWTIELKNKTVVGEYHAISAEHISGFVVLKKRSVLNEQGTATQQLMPHTYLCVMADKLESYPRWLSGSHVLRGDIMAHSLLAEAEIVKGHCIVIIGTRMEFYKFDSGKPELILPWPAERPHHRFKANWSLDMNTFGVEVAEVWWTWLATSQVVYQNGVVSNGSSKDPVGEVGEV